MSQLGKIINPQDNKMYIIQDVHIPPAVINKNISYSARTIEEGWKNHLIEFYNKEAILPHDKITGYFYCAFQLGEIDKIIIEYIVEYNATFASLIAYDVLKENADKLYCMH